MWMTCTSFILSISLIPMTRYGNWFLEFIWLCFLSSLSAPVFPIISVTLRENLKCLVRLIFEEPRVREHLLRRDPLEPNKSVEFPLLVNRILFPLLALAPPIIIAFSTQQIDILVSITGSFPGVGVQYVIPATMILLIQYRFKKSFGKYRNPYSTSLSHTIITCIVLVWSGVSVGMMIVDLALFPPKKSMPF